MAWLKNALSIRTSIFARGRLARTVRTQCSMKVSAPVGVVDIAGPMMHIEHLVGLGDGAKTGGSSCAHLSFSY